MGAVLEPFAPYKRLRVTVNQSAASLKEINGKLADVCPMGVTVKDRETFIQHPGCIQCGNCVVTAPEIFSQAL